MTSLEGHFDEHGTPINATPNHMPMDMIRNWQSSHTNCTICNLREVGAQLNVAIYHVYINNKTMVLSFIIVFVVDWPKTYCCLEPKIML